MYCELKFWKFESLKNQTYFFIVRFFATQTTRFFRILDTFHYKFFIQSTKFFLNYYLKKQQQNKRNKTISEIINK